MKLPYLLQMGTGKEGSRIPLVQSVCDGDFEGFCALLIGSARELDGSNLQKGSIVVVTLIIPLDD